MILSMEVACANLVLSVCLCSTAQGICMIIGGIKHREQRFNSRSAGVSSALLFISIGGMYGCTCNLFLCLRSSLSQRKYGLGLSVQQYIPGRSSGKQENVPRF